MNIEICIKRSSGIVTARYTNPECGWESENVKFETMIRKVFRWVEPKVYTPPDSFRQMVIEAAERFAAEITRLEFEPSEVERRPGEINLNGIHLYPRWERTVTPGALQDELSREVAPGHPLYGIPARALARRTNSDDVLFALERETSPFTVVHLTWTGRAEKPPMPAATMFASLQEWLEHGMYSEGAP